MLYLLVETEYLDFPWCQRSLRGLEDEARKKRLEIHKITDLRQIPNDDTDVGVLLAGATESWFHTQVAIANARGYYPITLNDSLCPSAGETCSTVTMDLRDSVRLSVDYLHSLGRQKLALYGVNPHSSTDPRRMAIFSQITGRSNHVYWLETTFDELFDRFRGHVSEYDGIICVSDYAAISLVRHLKAIGVDTTKNPYVMGTGNMHLSEISKPSITSVSDDYEYFGRAAVTIYNLMVREKSISSISIQLHSQLHIRQTTGNQPFGGFGKFDPVIPEEQGHNVFYTDGEVVDMSKMEVLLQQCDDTDLLIINALVAGASYAEIAGQCFISETAAKYRVRKMESLLGVSSRAKLQEYLKQFF